MLLVSGVNGIGAANGFDGSSVLLASGKWMKKEERRVQMACLFFLLQEFAPRT